MSYSRKSVRFTCISSRRSISFGLHVGDPEAGLTGVGWGRTVVIAFHWRRPEWKWTFTRHGLRYGCMYLEAGCFYVGCSGWKPKTRVLGEYDDYDYEDARRWEMSN